MLPDRISAVIINERKILLVRAKDSDFYITPGGKVELGESHQSTVERELEEELNTKLESMKLYLSYMTTKENSGEEQKVFCYLAKINDNLSVSNEIAEYKWFNKQNLPKLAKGIQDFVIPQLTKDGLLQ